MNTFNTSDFGGMFSGNELALKELVGALGLELVSVTWNASGRDNDSMASLSLASAI